MCVCHACALLLRRGFPKRIKRHMCVNFIHLITLSLFMRDVGESMCLKQTSLALHVQVTGWMSACGYTQFIHFRNAIVCSCLDVGRCQSPSGVVTGLRPMSKTVSAVTLLFSNYAPYPPTYRSARFTCRGHKLLLNNKQQKTCIKVYIEW